MALYLSIYFLSSVVQLLFQKVATTKLNHNSVALYLSFWPSLSLLLLLPFLNFYLFQAFENLSLIVLFLCIFKGLLLCISTILGQKLLEKSVSSTNFVVPLGLVAIVGINSFLGEVLSYRQVIAIFGISILSIYFLLFGHLSILNKNAKLYFYQSILVLILLGTIDCYVLQHTNWYFYLLSSNLVMFFISIYYTQTSQISSILFRSLPAVGAGISFSIFEISKFYLIHLSIPVSVMIAVDTCKIPVLMVFAACIFKEGTLRQQLPLGILNAICMYLLLSK
jgi:hypothetical protein